MSSTNHQPLTTKHHLVCGMEVHAELSTKSKMFCSCKNDPFHAPEPNVYTCPVCLGLPGALPVANQKAIEWTIKLGLALHCQINLFSKFDRKNYFYPDLPKGYQISQYDLPFCYDGYLDTSLGRVRIERIHLEEDTGKLLHKTIDGQKVSLIDFNRSSVPLVEIVTKPDITSAKQAKEYAKNLRQVLRFLGFANCDMEQGGMRLEANTSLSPDPISESDRAQLKGLPDYKVEVKNINSFRFLEQAIDFEIKRQSEILAEGKTPTQETRGFNPTKGITFSQRTKEEAADYRYFPDPDLPPFRFTPEQIELWRRQLPLLPSEVIKNWHQDFKVEPRFGELLFETQDEAKFFSDLFKEAQAQKLDINKLASLIVNGKIKSEKLEARSKKEDILKQYQAQTQVDLVDESEIEQIVDRVLAENAEALDRYRGGQTQLFNFFLGQVLKKLGKKTDVNQLRPILDQKLK